MAADARTSLDPIERLKSFTMEELAQLPDEEKRRLLAEANSAMVLVRRQRSEQAQPATWTSPTYSYRGGGMRGRGAHRGNGYRYTPYFHPQHRNSSVRFGTSQANDPVSAPPANGTLTSSQTATATESPRNVVMTGGIPGKTINQTRPGKLCRDYTSTGICRRGNTCFFIHDDTKKAICETFLKTGNCNRRCSRSHEASPHNTPPCKFFINGLCTKDDCRYAHVKVSNDAPVCVQFGELGYCEKGADCPNLHAYECPSFSNTGSCSNPKCKLPHVSLEHREGRPQSAVDQKGSPRGEKRNGSEGRLSAGGKRVAADEEMGLVITDSDESDHQEDDHDLAAQEDYVPLDVED